MLAPERFDLRVLSDEKLQGDCLAHLCGHDYAIDLVTRFSIIEVSRLFGLDGRAERLVLGESEHFQKTENIRYTCQTLRTLVFYVHEPHVL